MNDYDVKFHTIQEVLEIGATQERERIIKLLSDNNEEVAIALIKGENK